VSSAPSKRHEVAAGALRGAAVAIALVEEHAGLGVLLTRRAAGLRAHPGQWSLPGGKAEPIESPADAALRELHEELGVLAGQEDVLGLLDDYPTRSGYSITPVVAWLGRDRTLTIDEQRGSPTSTSRTGPGGDRDSCGSAAPHGNASARQ
jgi:8-oxo-dGTP pyrophosphatase MutT (NUDIX family)